MTKNLTQNILPNLRQGNREQVVRIIGQLIEENAPLENTWGGIARIATSLSEVYLAKECAQRYMLVEPKQLDRQLSYAGILCELGLLEEGLRIIEPFFKVHPRDTRLTHFMGLVNLQMGQLDKAKHYFKGLLNENIQSAQSWLSYATARTFKKNDPEIEIMKKILKRDVFKNNIDKSAFYYAMGKAADDTQQLDKAVRYFFNGAKIMKREKRYSYEKDKIFVDNLIQSFNKKHFDSLPESSNNFEPIFIVGLPRSGTTLISQIIQGHSNVSDSGEFNFFHQGLMACKGHKFENLKARANVLEGFRSLWSEVDGIYRHLLSERLNDYSKIVDKSLNTSRFLGVVSKVYPKASIIWISRNKQDNAWSCFNTFFSQSLDWSWDMKNIAQYFSIERKLRNHWENLLGDRILNISYEELVSNPEENTKKIFAHCHLEYESDKTEGLYSPKPIQTASVVQARMPIYTSSIGKFKGFEKYLAPFDNFYRH